MSFNPDKSHTLTTSLRKDRLDSEIGSQRGPARLLGPEAVSFAHPARHGPEPRTTQRPPSPVLPCFGDWMRVVLVPHAHSRHPRRDAASTANAPGPSSRNAARAACAMQHASAWWRTVSTQRCEEACDYFSRVREMLVVKVVSFW